MSRLEVATKQSKGEPVDENFELRRNSALNFRHLLTTMFKKRVNTDVTITVEFGNARKEIECHSLILSAHSPVLCARIRARLADDANKNNRSIDTVKEDPNNVRYFLSMMYWDWSSSKFENFCPQCDGDLEQAVSALSLAHRYKASHIIRHSEHLIFTFMRKRSISTTYKIYTLLNKLPIWGQVSTKMLRTVENCLLSDGEKLFSSLAIFLLNQTDLEWILEQQHLRCSELTIYKGCYDWGSNQCAIKGLPATGQNIRACLGNAIKWIRFPLLGKEMITSDVVPANLLTKQETIKLLVYAVNNSCPLPDFSIHPRIKFNTCMVIRLDTNFISDSLVDFSSPHGFTMSLSKEMTLYALEFFGGHSTSKNYRFNVELNFLSQEFVFAAEVTNFNYGDTKSPCITVKIEPSVTIPANVPVSIKFTITGGPTYASSETIDETTEELTYMEDGTMIIEFKSSPTVENGLTQIPRLLFHVPTTVDVYDLCSDSD